MCVCVHIYVSAYIYVCVGHIKHKIALLKKNFLKCIITDKL